MSRVLDLVWLVILLALAAALVVMFVNTHLPKDDE